MSDFDVDALGGHLKAKLSDLSLPLTAQRFAGGQSNPTYKLTDASGRAFVLRKKPAGHLLPQAHAIEREYRVIAALAGQGVPVAPALHLCDDDSVIGTPFYVMGFVEGRIFWDPTLPELTRSERGALYDDINRVISRLHSLDHVALGLHDFGRSGDYLARQIARWSRQYRASETEHQPAMEQLMAWLPGQVPPDADTRLIHGDLRLDNMIIHPTEPRVVAILDWELSTLGDPLADLNYHMITWILTADQFRGMGQADLPSLGIPDAEHYLARYVERTGCKPPSPEQWEVYTIYNLFRLAAILQGIAKRAAEGTASSAQAIETGRKARPIGELAWRRACEKLGAR